MTRWWGGGTALLLAALVPAACSTERIVLEHPFGGAGGGGGTGISGFDGGPGSGGNADASSDRTGHCPGGASNSLSYEQESPQIMIALDRSPSMGDPLQPMVLSSQRKITLTANAIMDVLGNYTPFAQFGYIEFPGSNNASSCGNNGCCATGLVQPVQQNGSFNQIFSELNSCVNQGQVSCDGFQATPTAQALNRIANTFQRVKGALYAVVITDGPPNQGCPLDPSNTSDSACDQTANQIFTMRNGSPAISTFVMVLGTPSEDPNNPGAASMCLSSMATAGGHVRSGTPSPTYIQALTDNQVDANLTAIVRSTICRIDITQQGFDPSVDADGVEVDLNGTPVLRDPPNLPGNGWSFDLDPNSRSTIILNGSLCDSVINKGTSRHLAVKGCLRSSTPFPAPAH